MRHTFPVIVHTVLWRRGELLLLRRGKTGFLDGWWALPGGHLEAGEDIVDCARRECREEAGVELAPAALRPLAVLPYRGSGGQGVDFIMSCERFVGDARLAEPEKFDALCWADPRALPPQTVPYLSRVLAMHERGDWFEEFHG